MKRKSVRRPRKPKKTVPLRLASHDLVERIARISENKKAVDVRILDMSQAAAFAEFCVVMTGNSRVHLKALVEGISEELSREGMRVPRWQGDVDSNWIILDLGSVVVHLFGKQERDYYNIEGLWEKWAVTYHF